MGNKNNKKTKQKQQKQQKQSSEWAYIDPLKIRYQHSRIRPYFSGCGRKVTDTLEQIRRGEISISDLPPIQVLILPNNDNKNNENEYYSLNNRRLWVLKKCKEEGLIDDNDGLIKVRVRQPKSSNECARYTVENCSLEAKFIRERPPTSSQQQKPLNDDDGTPVNKDVGSGNLTDPNDKMEAI